MRSLLRAVFCALTILLAACGDTSRVAVDSAPPPRTRPLPASTEYEGLPDSDSVRLWQATVHWLAVERWNAELARQADAERARKAPVAPSKPRAGVRPTVPAPEQPAANGGSVWDRLAQCESGGNWSYNGPSGFDGGLQFHPGTWTGYGGGQYAPYAWQASRSEQIAIAERVLAGQGWGAWPACSRKLGLR